MLISMAKITLLGGGPYHPFIAQATWFKTVLTPWGHDVTYTESRDALLSDNLVEQDLLILTSLDWSAALDQPQSGWESPQACTGSYQPLSDACWSGLQSFLAAGKPFLCHHCAIANWDEREELEELFDGRWIWGQSTHGPVGGQVNVEMRAPDHPINQGLTNFSITDELYYKLNGPKRCTVLMEAERDGQKWPLAWAGTTGPNRSRYFYSGLGHDMAAFGHPSLQRFLMQGINWLLEDTK